MSNPTELPDNILLEIALECGMQVSREIGMKENLVQLRKFSELARRAQPEGEAPQAGEKCGVDQTRLYGDARGGDCVRASIATLLGIALGAVPDFPMANSVEHWYAVDEFLNARGLKRQLMASNIALEIPYLASGKSSRGCSHMVVMCDGKLFHDPHPSRAGLISVDYVHLVTPVSLAATLSPLCGAQHAESGEPDRNFHPEYRRGYAAARAAQQAAAPGALPAQEHASTTRVTETKRAQLEARGYEVVGYVMQNSVNELCTLAHGRAEWLGKGTVTDYGTSAPGTPEAPQPAWPKRLSEEEVRELALQHLHDDTESAGRNSFFTFSAEGLDGFAIDLMDRAARLDGGQEGSDHA